MNIVEDYKKYIKPFTTNYNVRWDKETYFKLEAMRALFSNRVVVPSNADLLRILVSDMYERIGQESTIESNNLILAYKFAKELDEKNQ